MTVVESALPLASPLTCLAGLLGILLARRTPNLRDTIMVVAALVNLAVVVTMATRVLGTPGTVLTFTCCHAAPGLTLAFRVDQLALLFALVASVLWSINAVYAIGYMRGLHEHAQTRFFASFSVAIAAAMGVALAGNLFTLFVFYEVLTLSTYALVIHHEDHEAVGGGIRYLSILLGTSVGLQLPALVMIWVASGSLHGGVPNIEFGAAPLLAGIDTGRWGTFLAVAFVLAVFGVGKAALMPFHGWLPAAMVAPTPVSAFLHAVAVVKAGVFTVATLVIRVFGADLCHAIGVDVIVGVAAGFTIITASLVALRQDNLKRLLAYSTVGQLAYIVLGVVLAQRLSVQGGLFHIAGHAFAKITLFFCAGAIFVATGKKQISQMVGLGKQMPVTMGAFFVGTLGVIGLPPSGGFLSKWWLLQGTLQADQVLLLVVFLVSSFLNACYFFPIVFRAFFCAAPADGAPDAGIREAPLLCVGPLVLTAAVSVGLFFVPGVFFTLATAAAGLAFPGSGGGP